MTPSPASTPATASATSSSSRGSTRAPVRTVTDAVLRDPAHDWGIEKFAALTSMSRATFIRHFGREAGMNAGEFLMRLRMLLAAELLTESEQPVAAVAAAVGYAFGRAFRLAAGDTPPGSVARPVMACPARVPPS
ncbi:helix-turn-helix domain-containing protein [Streptomyces sp. NPDC001902]